MKQRDTTGLTAENRELKLRLQAMEEQAKLRDGMFFFLGCYFLFCISNGALWNHKFFFSLLLLVIN
jgi:hypothetical protein